MNRAIWEERNGECLVRGFLANLKSRAIFFTFPKDYSGGWWWYCDHKCGNFKLPSCGDDPSTPMGFLTEQNHGSSSIGCPWGNSTQFCHFSPWIPGQFFFPLNYMAIWQFLFPETWDTLWEFIIHIPSGNSTWLLNMAHSWFAYDQRWCSMFFLYTRE